ncbi:MAG TPA: zinc-ribbon domain-containing protein [Acetobacteraceae bacterium]|nr:zinc-ribbon domain-containing protein [Acetobacteraceae bacterium]
MWPPIQDALNLQDALNRGRAMLCHGIGDLPGQPESYFRRSMLGHKPKLWHSVGMRIVCPTCSAAYEVRDSLLAPGRTVRCARCGEQWVPIRVAPPPSSFSEPEPDAEPATELPPGPPFTAAPLTAMERLARQPAPLPREPKGLAAAWVASVVVLAVLGWGLVAWRGDVMHAWPPSMRLYDLLGLVPQPPAPPAR